MKASLIIFGIIAAMALGVGNGSGATNEVSGLLQKGLFEEEANHDLDAAIRAYQAVVMQTDKDHKFAATAIFRLGECYRKQGKTNEANAEYQRILKEFPDQTQLATLSRQQLGSAAEPAANGATAGQTPSQRGADALNADVKAFREADEIKRLQAMIKESPDLINADENHAGSPLIKAVEDNRLAVAKFLLDNKADTETRYRGATPLMLAAYYGNVQMADLLASHGADLNASGAASAVTPNASASIGGDTALLIAAGFGHNSVVEALLNRKVPADQRQDQTKDTALMYASTKGFKTVVETLLAHGADVNAANNDGGTALMRAVGAGNKAIAELLLARGANVNAADRKGQTALFVAIEKGNKATAEMLLANKADVNWKTPDGFTPLIDAVNGRHAEIVKLLLEHGADVNSKMADNHSSTPRWTALDAAVSLNDADMVKLLLEHHADPNARFDRANNGQINLRDETPLMMAAGSDEKDIAKILLANNADVNAKDSHGETALWRAYHSNNEMVALLLDNKADTEIKYKFSGMERTILGFAAGWGITNVAELFLAHGANVNAHDNAQMTPLHLAVALNSQPMVELLLAHGADVNAKDKDGNTPLDMWLKRGSGSGQPVFTIAPMDGYSGSGSVSYQWNFSGAENKDGKDIGTLLREHGGIAEVDVATIRVMRSGKLMPQVVFQKDSDGNNHYRLYDVLVGVYGLDLGYAGNEYVTPMHDAYSSLPRATMGLWPRSELSFPDLSKLKVIHLAEHGRAKADAVDVEKALAEGDCSKNISLKWGDIVDVPEMDHNVSENWPGLSQTMGGTLRKCLECHVSIIVKGKETKVTLTPSTGSTPGSFEQGTARPPSFVPRSSDIPAVTNLPVFWLSEVVPDSRVVLASSDLSRVTVKRARPAAGKPAEMIFNLHKIDAHSDLWLEDGDVIEIPEKSGE